ncbi:MAG: thiamine diphosphokinase [Erysipelotrichaceae bacterium]
MKRVCLVAGMSKVIPDLTNCDYIGVDGGAIKCLKQGIKMQVAIGDFDSITNIELIELKKVTKVIQLSTHKNETDSEAAIIYALKHKYDEIILYGGLGGRMDHELANLYLLIYRYPNLVLMNEDNRIRVLEVGTYYIPKEYTYLSFLALVPSDISEQGVAYPLDHAIISCSDIYTVSNEIIEEAKITIHYGKVLMMESNDKEKQSK